MLTSFNPFKLLGATQDWFTKTERSSGFRPYLIFLIIFTVFAIIVFGFFKDIPLLVNITIYSWCASIGGFIMLFGIKCFQDPNFCRSEKHVETIKRIELMEQKGDSHPKEIDSNIVEVIPNLEVLSLTSSTKKSEE
jgi:hypothetical protein